jgi:hypothetical protein
LIRAMKKAAGGNPPAADICRWFEALRPSSPP